MPTPSPSLHQRPPVPRPSTLLEDQGALELSLSRPWATGPTRLLTTLVVLGLAGLAAFHVPDLAELLASSPAALPAALVTSVLAYLLLGILLNETALEVHPTGLRVGHGPLWVAPEIRVPREEIQQVYSRRLRRHLDKSKDPRDPGTKERVEVQYELRVLLRDGRDELLIGGLTGAAEALYLEQELERSLGISDCPIDGEIDRGWRPFPGA